LRKWIAAAAVLLLIFGLCLLNIRCVDRLTDELISYADSALAFAAAGDYENAAVQAERASALWAEKDGYTHIFIRHSEIDSATDAFCEFSGAIYEQEPGEIRGAYEKLRAHLLSIAGMEHISFGSIM